MSKALQPVDILSPGANLDAYIQGISRIPILSTEEELELANQYFYQEDLDSARKLILSHLRFVVYIANSYKGYGLPLGDLIQEGNVGLMKAVKRFDPQHGVRLISFSVHWIKAEIHEFILRNWRIVKVATTKAQRKLFFNLRSRKTNLSWLTVDETKAIAEDLNVEPEQVKEMEQRLTAYDSSFDPPNNEDDDNAIQAPVYYLEDRRFDPQRLLENAESKTLNEDGLYAAIAELDERSKDILQQRWLQDNKATLHDLAAQYNVSAERIRQIEEAAMKKIRKKNRPPLILFQHFAHHFT